MRICSIDDCEREHRARGLCKMHYDRRYKYKLIDIEFPLYNPLSPRKSRKSSLRICSVDDCERKHRGRGFCKKHYERWRKNGDPNIVKRPQFSSLPIPKWTGDNVGYSGAHDRVKRARGAAKEYKCVDCGNQAQHWSYVGNDPRKWSGNVHEYEPRCAKCHRRLDHAKLYCERLIPPG